jgi:hypothetical protein
VARGRGGAGPARQRTLGMHRRAFERMGCSRLGWAVKTTLGIDSGWRGFLYLAIRGCCGCSRGGDAPRSDPAGRLCKDSVSERCRLGLRCSRECRRGHWASSSGAVTVALPRGRPCFKLEVAGSRDKGLLLARLPHAAQHATWRLHRGHGACNPESGIATWPACHLPVTRRRGARSRPLWHGRGGCPRRLWTCMRGWCRWRWQVPARGQSGLLAPRAEMGSRPALAAGIC